MISNKKDYQNIRSDREIATHLNLLELLLSQSNSDLQKDAKVRLDLSKKECMKWSREIGTIRISLLNNPQLVSFLGINWELFENRANYMKSFNKELQSKRATSTKSIKEIIKFIFWRMQDLSYEPIQQQIFIYDIYAENGFENYHDNKDAINKQLLEKIEQDQKKAKKEYTSARLGEIKKSLPPSE